MKDGEKRMDHEIENGIWNGKRLVYPRMENGEWNWAWNWELNWVWNCELNWAWNWKWNWEWNWERIYHSTRSQIIISRNLVLRDSRVLDQSFFFVFGIRRDSPKHCCTSPTYCRLWARVEGTNHSMSTPTRRSISFGTVLSPRSHHQGAPRCRIVLLPRPRRQYRSRFTVSANIITSKFYA